MNIKGKGTVLKVLVIICCVQSILCHARLMEPPSRSSMWRHGYETPKNYDDDGLYCGGMHTQWKQNGGKCGVCGDPWHLPVPRPNENGGKYGNGIIVRTYKPGQVIQAVVDITANHRGFFEFRVCANKHRKKEVTQECLDQNLLTILNQTSTRYYVDSHGSSRVALALQLPVGFTCKYCVFQWAYTAGNNWGKCKNGSFALGCGQQETFKSCADISISERTLTVAESGVVSRLTTFTTSKPTTTIANRKRTTTVTNRKRTTTVTNRKRTTTVTNRKRTTTVTNRKRTTTVTNRKRTTPVPSSITTDKNKKKKLPVRRPTIMRETFEEALDRIKKDPRLRWMLQTKTPWS